MSKNEIDIKDLNIASNFIDRQDNMVDIDLFAPPVIPTTSPRPAFVSPPNHGTNTSPSGSQVPPHYKYSAAVKEDSIPQTNSASQITPINQQTLVPATPQPQPACAPPSAPIIPDAIQIQMLKEASRRKRAYDAAEAYSIVYSTSFGLCTRDKSQKEHIVFPLHFQDCTYVEIDPDSLYLQKSFYRITFAENPIPLVISQKDLAIPSKLALALTSHYKISINLCGPKGKIYTGIQSFFIREAKNEKLEFYWGWKMSNKRWEYLLPNGKTHGERAFSGEDYIPFTKQSNNRHNKDMSVSVQLTAAIQAAEMMNTLSDVALRSIIWNTIHIASLHTLLSCQNRIPLGFCFYSEESQLLSVIETMFSWFQDRAIQLSDDKNRFYRQLTERKDQPLLIWDAEAQIQNSKMIEHAVATGVITYSKNTENSLQALPIVISNSLSHLSQSSKFVRFDLQKDIVSSTANRIIREKQDYFMDYLYYFNIFIQDNQDLFHATLAKHSESVLCEYQEYALSPECITLLETVYAIEEVIHLYQTSLCPHEGAKEIFDGLFSDKMKSILIDALMHLSCRDSDATICEIFYHTANQMIKDGCFDIREFGSENTFDPCPTDKQGVIYIFKNDPCFTKKAYDAVCNSTGYRYGIVKDALIRANAFKGPSTNTNTPQYRIPGYNPLTKQEYTAVYWLSNEMIILPAKPVQYEQPTWIKDSSECNITLQLGCSVDGFPMIWNGRENSHICISGLSGSGKSYFLKKMIAQLPAQKVRCIIFDTSGDFSSTSHDKNPPEWPMGDLEVVDMENTKAQKMFFKLLSPGDNIEKVTYRFVDILNRKNHFGRNQKASLIKCLEFGFEQNQLSNFNDLLEMVKQKSPYSAVENAIKNLNTILPYGKDDFDWHLDEPGITVLDFHSGHDDDSLKTVIELLLSTICATRMYMNQDDYPPVVLVFDECQLYDWKKGAYTYDIMVRGRKYGLSAWLSTQALTLINNPEIPEQANLRVCFKPTDNEIPQIVKKFYLSSKKEKEACKTNLANLVRGQFICKLNGTIHISQPPQKK